MRPTWEQYFMEMAKLASSRSTCRRRHVGAILVRDNRIISTGYNGSPSGISNCIDDDFCVREEQKIPSGQRHELCRGVHAEQNAIIQAAVHGVSTKDAIMYTTTFPCSICAKMIVNAQIKEIVWYAGYPDDTARHYLGKKLREYRV